MLLRNVPARTAPCRQAQQARQEGISEDSVLLLQTYLGLGWTLGCCAFGFVVVRNNQVGLSELSH